MFIALNEPSEIDLVDRGHEVAAMVSGWTWCGRQNMVRLRARERAQQAISAESEVEPEIIS